MHYIAVARPSIIELEDAVNDCIEGGYTPLGNVFIAYNIDNNFDDCFVQAMIHPHKNYKGEYE